MSLSRLRPPRALVVTLALVLAACGSDGPGGVGPVPVTTDPAAAEIFTTDVANFWRAYDAGGRDGAAVPFQQQYLAPASPGLAEFAALRSVTAASLADMMRRYPRYFASVRSTMLGLATNGALDARLRSDYARMKELYPDAVFPRVSFLVGRFSTKGTTGESGLLIATEFYAPPDAPRDELGPFQAANVSGADSLPFVVAHELVHVQQSRGGFLLTQRTLLAQALREGSADFVGELVSGGIINGAIYAWALPREAEVWADFRDEMNGTDVSRWLYNQGTDPDRPGDLGYFVGYRIAQAYYERQADKAAALRDIIRVRDAAAFLAASGYDPR